MSSPHTNKTFLHRPLGRSILFLIILIGLLPSIHDYSLFFFDLGFDLFQVDADFFTHLQKDTGFLFLIGLIVLPYLLFELIRQKEYGSMLGLLPYGAYLLSYVELYVLKSSNPIIWEYLLYFSSVISFLYYLIKGSLFSWVFPLFLIVVWMKMSGLQMILFAGYALAFRFVYLLIIQNWDSIKALGAERLAPLLLRSFLLWSPMLLVVVFSYWSTKQIEDLATEGLYSNSFLERFPAIEQLKTDSITPFEKPEDQRKYEDELYRNMKELYVELSPLRSEKRRFGEAVEKREINAEEMIAKLNEIRSKEDTLHRIQARLGKSSRARRVLDEFNFIIDEHIPFDTCFVNEEEPEHLFSFLQKKQRIFERDLKISLCLETERKKVQCRQQLIELRKKVDETSTEFPKALGDMVRASFSDVMLKPSQVDLQCPWYRVDCHIGEGATKTAVAASGEAFEAAGDRLAQNVENKTRDILKQPGKSTNQKLREVQLMIDAELEVAEDATYDILVHTYRLISFILFVMDLIFFFIVIKSFVYVFARVLFSEDKGTFITLGDLAQPMQSGNISSTGNTYTIPANSTPDFYVSRTYEPSGRAPKISIPQATTRLISRLYNRAWTMNHVVMEEGRSSVKFNAPGGKEFVEWKLAEGEVVIFHYKHFVAMSESVRLSKIISLRISSLLLGRIIFSTAQGPGTLVLSTKGKPITNEEQAAGHSIPESRLLAWQQNTRFYVESELNVFDVFFSGIYLKRKEQDMVLIDSDQIGSAKSGIFKFFYHFLLPI